MPALDESTADDGAIFAFWAFVERRRRRGITLDPTNVAELRQAIAAFDAGDD